MFLVVYFQAYVGVEYIVPSTPLTDLDERRFYSNNANVINAIMLILNQYKLVKIMHWKYAKNIWDKINKNYKRYSKVNKFKLQTQRMRFESL